MSASDEQRLRAVYAAFNRRDIEGALESMHSEVDWTNAWEEGRVVGREAVRDYWTRQVESIRSTVEPERIECQPDGSIVVTVRQVVNDAGSGALLADGQVGHRYWMEDDLITRMDVVEPPNDAD